MIIGLTGATGFIGSRLAEIARASEMDVVGFSRRPGAADRLIPRDTPPDLSGLDAVVNLAGESILGLWTASRRERIRRSRVEGTRRIVEGMAALEKRPSVLVNASAIGFYGDTGDRMVDESAPLASGFLADVCGEWEAEAEKAEALGVRVVCVRIGFVLGREGAMKLIRPVFSLGLGGPLGCGRQWMSCVHVDDVAGICLWAAKDESVRGPVNAVLPEPVRNCEFTRAVAHAVHRPAFLPAPAPLIRLALGDLSQLLLGSVRVVPAATLAQGYEFRYPTLAGALKASLA